MNHALIKSHANGNKYQLRTRRGLTMIELIVAMAIAVIVGMMTLTMFIFPQRIVNKGEKRSDVQFDLRMASQAITDSSRLASGIELMAEGASIPDAASLANDDNHDVYFFIRSSDGAFIRRDLTGDRVIVQLSDLDVLFESHDTGKTLVYSISGVREGESFSLDTQVVPLNLPKAETIIDSSGVADAGIIRIENITEIPDVTNLYFVLNPPLDGVVGSYFRADFEAFNNASENLVYHLDPDLLPAGLTLADRSIRGTPTEAGQFPFEVKLTDGTQTATRSFVIAIAADENSEPEDLPTVSGLQLTGTIEVGFPAEGLYSTFTDPTVVEPPLTEGASTVIWRTKESLGSTSSVVVSGPSPVQAGTEFDYMIKSADAGKYLFFEITPVNSEGVSGLPVSSEAYLVVANAAPTVSALNVTPEKNVPVGGTITATFTYNDVDGDLMDRIRCRWYRSNKDDPSHQHYTETVAAGPNNIGQLTATYQTTAADAGMFISLELVPYAATGELEGEPVRTVYVSIKNN